MIEVVFAAWAVVVVIVTVVACVRSRPLPRRSAASPDRVLLVRPVSGATPWLEHALRRMPRGFGGRVLLCVDDPRDPARPITRAVAAELRRNAIDAGAIVADGAGINRKVAQLADAMARHGAHVDVVLIADADVDLASLDLDALWGALAPDVAACWMPCIETRATTFADRASRAVLGASLHAFPVLAGIDRELFVGKLFAVRTDALARIGGFARIADRLGEDAAFARALRAEGEPMARAPGHVRSMAVGRSAREIFARFVRWALVVRAQRAHLLASYPLLFAPTPLALVGALAIRTPAAVASASLVLASRWVLAAVAMRRCERRVRVLDVVVDAAISDVLVLAAFARACLSRRVRWREHELRLGRDGRLRAPAQQHPGDRIESAHERALGR